MKEYCRILDALIPRDQMQTRAYGQRPKENGVLQEKKRSFNLMVFKRNYDGEESGYLQNWLSKSERTADGEVQNTLKVLRRLSCELLWKNQILN